jgi:AbrB family looped-hinge helix DNA binding protein
MRSTVDTEGRIEIPRELREAARLRPGMVVEVCCRDGRIEIEETRDRPLVPVRLLTPDDVRDTLDRVRR